MRIAIAFLACFGALIAGTMIAKATDAAAGRLKEPSVVELPEARLFLGLPNAAFGLGYYGFVVFATALDAALAYGIAAVLSLLALATSVYLGHRLVGQHLSCSRCWTAHAINVILCPLLVVAAIAR